MEDRVSREAKMMAAKEIVTAYIKTAVVKEGENQKLTLSGQEICNLFREVYTAIDEAVPSKPRQAGFGV